MLESLALLVFVTLQRGAELVWGRRNEAALRKRGAVEIGARHYPLIVFLHASWLVKRGPFRLIPHPNYTVVALEMPVLPLAFGLWGTAIAFGLLNLAMLAWRIRAEEAALAPLRT
jgi:methyltransferase